MSDYPIGYGRPPKHSQFKPGTSGNPKGRPKRELSSLLQLMANTFQAAIEYRRRGKVAIVSRHELFLTMIIEKAAVGDLDAMIALLAIWQEAEKHGGGGFVVEVEGWWPDADGQTAVAKDKAVGEELDLPDVPPVAEDC